MQKFEYTITDADRRSFEEQKTYYGKRCSAVRVWENYHPSPDNRKEHGYNFHDHNFIDIRFDGPVYIVAFKGEEYIGSLNIEDEWNDAEKTDEGTVRHIHFKLKELFGDEPVELKVIGELKEA